MDNKKLISSANLQIRRENEDQFIVCSDEQGFETNSVGMRVIELCKDGLVFPELVALLAKEFDASEEVIFSDLEILLPELIENKIIFSEEEK
jgi:hypothetical protein